MIRLDVRGNIGDKDWVTLDLTESPDVKLNKEIIDIRNFFERKSDRSQLFTLPFTKANDSFFNYAFELNATFLTFNNRRKADAIIYESGIPVLSGYIKLIKADKVKKLYECVVIGEVGSFGADIKDKRLFTLFDAEDDLDFDLTPNNIKLGFEGVMRTRGFSTAPGTDLIFCPLLWNANFGLLEMKLTTADNPINVNAFTFAINLKHIINRIFEQAGYTYTSDFLSTDLEADNGKLYCLFNREQPLATGDTVAVQTASTATPISITGSASLETTVITTSPTNLEVDTADPLILEINYTATTSAANYKFASFIVQRSTDEVNWVDMNLINSPTGQFANLSTPSSRYIFLDNEPSTSVSGRATMYISTGFAGTSYYRIVVLSDEATLDLDISLSFTIFKQAQIQGTDVIIRENIDNQLMQGDFIRSIFERFNLYVEQDPSNSKNLIIEPYNDFFSGDVVHDWTNNIVNDDSIEVMPISDLIKKSYYFSEADSDNYLNQLALGLRGVNYGARRIEIADDFAQGEQRIFSIFEPATQTLIPNSSIATIGTFTIGDDGVAKKRAGKPMIVTRLQQHLDAENQFIFHDFINQPSDIVYTVSGAGTFTDIPLTSNEVDNNFSLSSYNTATLVSNYNGQNVDTIARYFSQFISEISSQDIKVIKLKLQLTPTEYQQFSFRDLIFLIDSYWRVNKISGYSLRNQMATVELIKVVAGLPKGGLDDCDLLVDEVKSSTGEITFTDGEGTSQNATESCCQSLGISIGVQTIFRDLGGGNVICFSPDLQAVPNIGPPKEAPLDPRNAIMNLTAWDDSIEYYSQWIYLKGQDLTKIPPNNNFFQFARGINYKVYVLVVVNTGTVDTNQFADYEFDLYVNANGGNILLSPITLTTPAITHATITVAVQSDGIRVALNAISGSGEWRCGISSFPL